jgi:predicted KAP-like P-loop ATPase
VFKPDQPIESASEDLLGRALFAKSLGEAILSYKHNTSVVTALYGRWGSGKSSVVNMVLEHVQGLAAALPNTERPIVIQFNPWSYSDQNQLIAQFFRELSVALKRKDYGVDAQKVGKQLEVYSEFFKPLALVEPTGFGALLAIGVSKVFKLVGSATKSWGDLKSKDLTEIRAQIDGVLAKQQRKILIVIDDIDRLNNLEIRQVFQLVKVLGDFPNTIYLLAFDQAIVINALKSVQEGSGSEYLEKIVQIPFELPSISRQEVEQLLFSHLNEIIKDVPEAKWDHIYWGNVYQSGLNHFFETIRDVNRFINSMRFGFLMVKDDVNPIDFFAITALHVFEPALYVGIRDNKDLFAGVFGSESRSADPEYEQAKKRCDEILERASVLPKEKLNDLLSRLFPKLESIYGHMGYGYDFLEQWRRNGRVCSPDNFDIYFRLSIPKGELSPKEIETILNLAGNRDAFADALLKLKEDGRIIRFLERMEDYTRETIPDENIEPIINALMDIGDLLPEGRRGMFETDTPMRILRLFYQLSQRIDDQGKRFEIFTKAIKDAKQSLYTIVHEVGVQGQQHGKNRANENQAEPEARRTVNSAQLPQLEQRACEKIREWAADGRLKDHPKLVGILYSWKRWCPNGAEEVDNFVRELVVNDYGLITLISSFLSKSYAHGMSDHVARVELRIHLDSVKEFIPVADVEPRVREIYHRDDFKNLPSEQQTAIKIFLDTVDGKIKDW